MLFDGPEAAPLTVALAHGAGAPMDSPFMAFFAEGLAKQGFRAARFEFPYMARRRQGGRPGPPDRPEVLLSAWRSVIAALGAENLVIGGKSLGGRIASALADEARVRGLVCLGYPFHAPGRPEAPRIGELARLETPTLVLQGERDPLGNADEVAGYAFSPSVRLHWLPGGDHGFKPPKASGRSERENWEEALAALADFLSGL
jgi:predicted alpha/beta-hydrolase family hydrolase